MYNPLVDLHILHTSHPMSYRKIVFGSSRSWDTSWSHPLPESHLLRISRRSQEPPKGGKIVAESRCIPENLLQNPQGSNDGFVS